MKLAKYRSFTGAPFAEEFEDLFTGLSLHYFASDLSSLGVENGPHLHQAVNRAMIACRSAEISIANNFKEIYISRGGMIYRDWKISSLARKLIILNAEPSNPIIAKLQVKLAHRI